MSSESKEVRNKKQDQDQDGEMKRFVQEVAAKVEDRLNERMKKNWMIFRIIGTFIFIIMLPAGWYAVNELIKAVTETKIEQINKVYDQKYNQMRKDIELKKASVDRNLVALGIVSKVLNAQQHGLTQSTSSEIISDLKYLLNNNRVNKLHQGLKRTLMRSIRVYIGLVLDENYENNLTRLKKDFPDFFENDVFVLRKQLYYYGLKVLAKPNTERLRQSTVYRDYLETVEDLSRLKLEKVSLPLEIIISYHLAGNKKNKQTQTLLSSASILSPEYIANLLWQIAKYSNPVFWESHSSPHAYLISSVYTKFMIDYKLSLVTLSDTDGVKSFIMSRYRSVDSYKELNLGKYLIEWLYGIKL